MGRYTGPKWKLSRREGMDLFSRGAKAAEGRPLARRNYPPGQHAQRITKLSDYGLRLREKQKLKRIYGVRERQCLRLFREAVRMKGDSGKNLLSLMERRLDAVVTNAGLARTIPQARQLVAHGHFMVNGKRMDIPSYRVKVGDQVAPVKRDGTQRIVSENLDVNRMVEVPGWLQVDPISMSVDVMRAPTREEFPYAIIENLIVEFYSR